MCFFFFLFESFFIVWSGFVVFSCVCKCITSLHLLFDVRLVPMASSKPPDVSREVRIVQALRKICNDRENGGGRNNDPPPWNWNVLLDLGGYDCSMGMAWHFICL